MSRANLDLAGGIFGVAALALGVLSFFFVPFAFGPLGLACLVIAILCSSKYKGLCELAAVAIAFGVVIGAWVAVVLDNPLY